MVAVGDLERYDSPNLHITALDRGADDMHSSTQRPSIWEMSFWVISCQIGQHSNVRVICTFHANYRRILF